MQESFDPFENIPIVLFHFYGQLNLKINWRKAGKKISSIAVGDFFSN